MIDNNQHEFSNEMIRSFLLGDLTGGDQSLFEERLFTDDELAARVRLAELELCDEHASKRNSDREHQIFRKRFLVTGGRKQALQVSTALGDRFKAKTMKPSLAGRIRNFININQAVWKYAFAGLILIIVVTAAVLVTRDRLHIVRPFTPPRVSPRPTASATPQFANHSNNPVAPAHREQSPALPAHESLAPSVVLSSNTPIDTSPVMNVPRSDLDFVRLQLTLDQPAAEHYDVNVTTLAGESVFSANSLERTENKLLLEVPANAMGSRDYKIWLTGIDGETKRDAGIYYFRVR